LYAANGRGDPEDARLSAETFPRNKSMKVHVEVEVLEVDGQPVPAVAVGKKPAVSVDSVPTDGTKVRLEFGERWVVVKADDIVHAIRSAQLRR
jgi:hypothetical protein